MDTELKELAEELSMNMGNGDHVVLEFSGGDDFGISIEDKLDELLEVIGGNYGMESERPYFRAMLASFERMAQKVKNVMVES